MSSPKVSDDPRDASLATPLTLPPTWSIKSTDAFGTSGMMLSGMIMLTRNRFLAWPALMFGIAAMVNAHPARSKEGANYSSIFLAFSALFASYLPMFLITKAPPIAQGF